MDPISMYRLGQIRQREILAECLGEQYSRTAEAKRVAASLWERVRFHTSAAQLQRQAVPPIKKQSQKAIA